MMETRVMKLSFMIEARFRKLSFQIECLEKYSDISNEHVAESQMDLS